MPRFDAKGRRYAEGFHDAGEYSPLAERLHAQHVALTANPPPVAPLRVTCANRKCGGRALLNAKSATYEATVAGGRLDPDGRFWCCARCLPPPSPLETK